jgi:Membrane domain of glycerophosphoryl diester phosphodiesterase
MRPLGVGEVLDVSINLFFRNFKRLLGVAAVLVIPLTVVIFALDMIALQEASVSDPNAAFYEIGDTTRVLNETRYILVSVISAAVGLIAYLLIIGASFRAVSEAYFDRDASARTSVGYAARRAHSLLWLTIVTVLAIGGGVAVLFFAFSFLAMIFAFWALVVWSVAIPALMVEDARGTKALRRSFNLVRNSWWRTFGALLVGFVFVGLFQLLAGLVQGAVGTLAEDSVPAYVAVLDITQAASIVLTAPLQAAIATVIYYNLRVRREGLDIAVLVQRLPDTAPASGLPPGGAPASSEP